MTIKEWKPISRPQEDYLALPVSIREAMFGGSAGPGKSECLMMYPVVREWYKHPRFKALFTRRTYKQLKEEIIPRSRELYTALGGRFNQSDLVWDFSREGGGLIFFGHIEHENDVYNYDSMEINLFLPDELQTITEFMYTYIAMTRVRTSVPELPAIIRSAGMPGNIGHCVPCGEVLTPNGWIDIKDIQIGDAIYEVDDKGNLVLSNVEQKHIHNHSGQLVQIKTSNIEILCTSGHRIARKNVGKGYNNFVLTPAGQLPFQANIRRTSHLNFGLGGDDIRIGSNIIPYRLYLKLLGWFLSEGHTVARDYAVGISQTKLHNWDEISDLLVQCKIQFSANRNGFLFYGKDYYNHFCKFGLCRDKYIPREVLNGPYLDDILESLMAGDGHWVRDGYGHYYTTSEQLADDFSELATKCGYRVDLSNRQRNNRVGLSYQISIMKRDYTEVITYGKRSNINHPKYEGLVYDIGVPKYHTFVIRQFGHIWVSGNSWVKRRFIKPSPKGNTVIVGKGGNKRIFIFSTLADNPKIDPNYKNALDALPSEAERRAKKFGDWDAYEGMVFEEFRDKHYPDEPENAIHIIPRFDIPEWWPKIVCIDWGYKALTYALYAAISPTRRVYVYREQSWRGTKISEWAPYVREMVDRENVKLIKVCGSAKQDRGQEHTILQQLETELGTVVEPFANTPGSRVATKLLLHEYLRWEKVYVPIKEQIPFDNELALKILRNEGEEAYKKYMMMYNDLGLEDNIPKLQIFDKSLEGKPITLLPEAIKSAVYDKTHVEDVAEWDGDDPYDTVRIMVDAADRFFGESETIMKQMEKRQKLVEDFEKYKDYNRLHHQARALESGENNLYKPVRRFHGGRSLVN